MGLLLLRLESREFQSLLTQGHAPAHVARYFNFLSAQPKFATVARTWNLQKAVRDSTPPVAQVVYMNHLMSVYSSVCACHSCCHIGNSVNMESWYTPCFYYSSIACCMMVGTCSLQCTEFHYLKSDQSWTWLDLGTEIRPGSVFWWEFDKLAKGSQDETNGIHNVVIAIKRQCSSASQSLSVTNE